MHTLHWKFLLLKCVIKCTYVEGSSISDCLIGLFSWLCAYFLILRQKQKIERGKLLSYEVVIQHIRCLNDLGSNLVNNLYTLQKNDDYD